MGCVHYSKNNWPLRKSDTPGTENIAHQCLVDPCKVLLPPPCIKFGLMKNFIKALDRNGPESCSCVRTSLGLVWRRLRWVYSLAPNMSTLQRPWMWCCCQWWHECSLEYLLTCCDWFSRKCKSRQVQKACGGSYNILQEAHLQHITQDVFPPVTLGLISAWLWCHKWWTLWLFLPGHLSNGEQMQGQMECCNFNWLLLDSEEDAVEIPYKQQAKGALFNSCKFTVASCFQTAV